MISLLDVTKRLGSDMVLSHVTLNMERGTITCLRGVNGSGKTMLLRMAAGLILPTRGTVSVDGLVLGRDIEFPPSMGLLIERPAFISSLAGLKNLLLLASLRNEVGEDEIRASIERVGLSPDDRRPVRKYSLGMRQRLGIAAAIMEHPDFVILDEPFNGLDAHGIELIVNLLNDERDRGACLAVSCHALDEFEEQCDKIVTMRNGYITDVREGAQAAQRNPREEELPSFQKTTAELP